MSRIRRHGRYRDFSIRCGLYDAGRIHNSCTSRSRCFSQFDMYHFVQLSFHCSAQQISRCVRRLSLCCPRSDCLLSENTPTPALALKSSQVDANPRSTHLESKPPRIGRLVLCHNTTFQKFWLIVLQLRYRFVRSRILSSGLGRMPLCSCDTLHDGDMTGLDLWFCGDWRGLESATQ